jgi:hypothetical protein
VRGSPLARKEGSFYLKIFLEVHHDIDLSRM